MHSKMMVAALLLVVPAAASAQSMNAEQFHRRATALQQKGLMALFSGSEIKALTAEAQAAGAHARDLRAAAMKAGRPPRFCPPKGPVTMGDKEFMTRLSAIPAADRARIDMTEAMTRILAVKYPCRA
jgi:hypothetical protein